MSSDLRARKRHPERFKGWEDKGGVVFSTLSPTDSVSAMFEDSVEGMLFADGERPQDRRLFIRPGGGRIRMFSGPRIAEARSQIVDKFLNAEHLADAEWLFMVDSDMVFRHSDVLTLYQSAHKIDRPIVGGLCFGGMMGVVDLYPTIYVLERSEAGIEIDRVLDYPKDQLAKCDATGGAFMLVHRSVFEKMGRAHPHGFATMPSGAMNPYPWFAEGHMDARGMPMGEDIVFCMRANALGVPVYVHTGVRVGHHKSVVLTEELFDAAKD